ncbi:MAG TPA: ABC transporter permease [Actinobacteria bacterium]|nr:ABC transporter permease [Actinomycetota bacterium]
MKKIVNLAWLNILQILRNKEEIFGILILPVLLTFIFSAVFGGGTEESKVPVIFVDEAKTEYSRQVYEQLKEVDSFSVKEDTRADAKELLTEGKIDAVVIAPDNLCSDVLARNGASMKVLKNPGSARMFSVVEVVNGIAGRMAANARTSQIIQEVVSEARKEFESNPLPLAPGQEISLPPMPVKNFSEEIKTELSKTFPYLQEDPNNEDLYWAADEKWEPEPPVSVEVQEVIPSEVRGESVVATGYLQFSLGFTVMFIMFIVLNGAGGILDEREAGTLSRLLTTPTPKAQLLLGKIVAVFLTGALEAVILIGFSALVFDVPWGRNPLSLIIIVGAYLLAVTGLAVFLSAMVRTRGQLSAIGPVVAVALAMIGGCFWPTEIVSPFMRRLADFTPTGWAMYGLVDIVARNRGVSEVAVPSLALFGFAVFFFCLGVRFLKFE